MSNGDNVNSFGATNDKTTPPLTNPGQTGNLRMGRYGEQFVQLYTGVRDHAAADDGSSWVATNVPGTPIVDGAAVTAFVATTPTLVMFNSNAAGGKTIYPKRFKLQAAAAGTNGTNWLGQWLVDTGNRWTSGGTLLTTANCAIGQTNLATGLVAHFGAVLAPAANASRILHSASYRTVLKVIGDVTTFEWGTSAPTTPGMPTDGTLQLTQVLELPAMPIPPQCSLLWYEYAASQSVAASFDYLQLEYLER